MQSNGALTVGRSINKIVGFKSTRSFCLKYSGSVALAPSAFEGERPANMKKQHCRKRWTKI